jgi:type 1 glutamine amidotransferase
LVQLYGDAIHRQILALVRDVDAADAKRMPLPGLQALSSPDRAEYYSYEARPTELAHSVLTVSRPEIEAAGDRVTRAKRWSNPAVRRILSGLHQGVDPAMSRSRDFLPRVGLVMFAAFGLASIGSPTWAQRGLAPHRIKFKEPVASRVYQRDANGKAEIPIVLDDNLTPESVDARISSVNMAGHGIKLVDGKFVGVPVGGPYTITCSVSGPGGGTLSTSVGPLFVGDLWVLAGQSNMEGVGDLIDVTSPNPRVMLLGMDGKWATAEEPLHWLVDSPDPVHSGDPNNRADRSAQFHKARSKGAGLGLPFAVAMVESTGVPVGLIAAAHGGTSMEQWNPAKKEVGGNSLYGSMLRQVKLAGGKVRGVLWYQGESDAMGGAWRVFPKVFSDFIAAVRSDFGQPELPFYYVQIGRFVTRADPKGWNIVQDAQRVLVDRVPNTAVVSVIDLELDDGIHVGTQGLKRAGHRLARIAQRELFGQIGATTPTFDRVSQGPQNTLTVKFKGVNMGSARPARMGGGGTMAGQMMGMGGMSLNPGEPSGIGLKPERHIAGFSIRKEDGTALPLIFEAGVGKARDTVVLKLSGPLPAKAALWYGYGLDPHCNLVDGSDMAVPVFGPIALNEIASPAPTAAGAQPSTAPVNVLVITGDNVSAHKWQENSKAIEDILEKDGRIKVDITATPSKDLTEENLAKYDVLLLNYKETPAGPPESRWSDSNKAAFLKAVHDGKGLVGYHFASSAFTKPNWDEFEKAVAGGWRTQGFHGPAHVFTVKKTDTKHAISDGLPAQFEHTIDELYQNSMILPGSVVLATAYSDPKKPRGTGKDEPVIWVSSYGKGRVYENVLGHDSKAMADPKYQDWLRRGVIWAATGKVD